jgi:hypothetical protein
VPATGMTRKTRTAMIAGAVKPHLPRCFINRSLLECCAVKAYAADRKRSLGKPKCHRNYMPKISFQRSIQSDLTAFSFA